MVDATKVIAITEAKIQFDISHLMATIVPLAIAHKTTKVTIKIYKKRENDG